MLSERKSDEKNQNSLLVLTEKPQQGKPAIRAGRRFNAKNRRRGGKKEDRDEDANYPSRPLA